MEATYIGSCFGPNVMAKYANEKRSCCAFRSSCIINSRINVHRFMLRACKNASKEKEKINLATLF